MSPITEAMKPSRNSDRQSCASSGELLPKNGTAFATESPTTFVSSRPTSFGSSRRAGIAAKIFSSAVGETEMIADPKRKPHQDNGDSDKRRHQEEALDEALKNTFPASDPVSVEQPTTSGRSCRS